MIILLFWYVAFIIGENTLDLLRLCHVLPGNVNVVGDVPRFIADGKFATNPTRVSKDIHEIWKVRQIVLWEFIKIYHMKELKSNFSLLIMLLNTYIILSMNIIIT
jgi:hypothetical protein